jgi:hypothetical protein
MTNPFVEHLAADAAAIASTGNGLPADDYKALAVHVLAHVVGYRHRSILSIDSTDPLVQQDVDYLARVLQATAAWHDNCAGHK